ncbi:isochorismatase family protein [Frigidibacter sp. MR17.24]|uniref:isochorismatase family protein n=1 Tax=Frigidibacter sp. MR17.24 TaxID=3127345 RepID=UPI003013103D
MKALAIVDMQMGMQIRIAEGRDCVNPEAPARVGSLVEAFRQKGLPVIHVRHRDKDRASIFHADAAGYPPLPCAEALDGEPVFVKHTSSAFASTDLANYLRGRGITELIVVGAVAGFCINSTVRAGADLGFNMTVVEDAVIGFDLPSAKQSARVIFDVTMAHLAADFACVTDTATELSA